MPTIGYYREQQLVYSNSSLALSDCLTSCWNHCLWIAYGSQFDNGTECKFWSKGAHFIRNPDFNAIYILSQRNSTGTYDFAIIYLQLLVDLILCIFCIFPSPILLFLSFSHSTIWFCYMLSDLLRT